MRWLTLIRGRVLSLYSMGALSSLLSFLPVGHAEEQTREPTTISGPAPRHHLFNASWRSGQPRGLSTGRSSGLELEYLYPVFSADPASRDALTLRLGMDLGYAGVQENSRVWAVQHHEWSGAARVEGLKRFGRGSLGLSLALGGALIQERRDRHQAARLDEATLEMNIENFRDQTRQFIPEMKASFITRVRLIKLHHDELGLSASARIAWLIRQGESERELTPWGWAVLIGAYWEIGVTP